MFKNKDLLILNENYNIYLKEIFRILLKITVPFFKNNSKKVISNWEILEKIHLIIQPYSFINLKVILNSVEEIKLEGETQTEEEILKIIKILQNKRIKLSGFSDSFLMTASIFLIDYPNKNDWLNYFNNFYPFDKPGERPDTLHIKGLPTLWFSDKISNNKPSQKIVENIFNKFGEIRNIYIPILNPIFENCNGNFGSIVSMNQTKIDSVTTLLTFEAFIQYKHISDFNNAIINLKNKKLVFKDQKIDSFGLPMDNWFNAEIVIDFDRMMNLSENSIYKRDLSIKEHYRRLLEVAEKARKEEELMIEKIKRHDRKRRRCEEEKKRRIQEEEDKIKQLKIQRQLEKDERDLLISQRNVESIRLLSFLFDIIRSKEEVELLRCREMELEVARQKLLAEEKLKIETESKESTLKQKQRKEELLKKELELRSRLLKKLNQQKSYNKTKYTKML